MIVFYLNPMDLDAFIDRVRRHERVEEREFMCVLRMAQEVLFEEGSLLNVTLPITVCGDIHGQFYDLLRLFEVSGDPADTKYLFLGDYVDRGFFSVQTFALLIAYKVKYPTTFFMLRGNHEARQVNTMYGFYDEIVQSFGHAGPWKLCNDVFDMLPLAAVISNRIYCVHGGLSPDIRLADQVALLERRQEVPVTGPITDMVWSDPEDMAGWGRSTRGAGWLYGRKPTEQFCRNNKIELIARAHQLMLDGYMYHFGGEQLVTVWSAPNYMYRTINRAAVMKLDDIGERNFVVFDAVPDSERRMPNDGLSSYFL